MKVSEKIKELRAEKNWSQEQMAEKIGVSRQAITKWETNAGTPDIENLAAIAQLFGVSTDLLLFGEDHNSEAEAKRFESITSLDVSKKMNYDITVGCANKVVLRSADNEKVAVRLSADSISDLGRAFKVALDTEGRSFDIDVTNTGIVADSLARQELEVVIELPAGLTDDAEIELNADELHIKDAAFHLEVGGNAEKVWIENAEGHIELDIPIDVEIWVDDVRGKIDVNQMGTASILHVAHDAPFTAATRGRLGKRTLRFTKNGEPVKAPTIEDAPLAIELAGARCELTVDSMS